MKKLYILIAGSFLFAFLAILPSYVKALSPSNGVGVYTNLCGTGTAATVDSCNKGCNPEKGTCSGTAVAKFVCDGRQNECGGNKGATPIKPEEWGISNSIDVVGCGQTVQLDVYTEKCRLDNGNWKEGCQPVDYMVWYSGDCSAPPPGPTCSYGSTQARWQKDTSDPWGEGKTINVGQSARVGGFHDGTGQFADNVTLTVTGSGTSTTLGNGGTFRPAQAGNYQLTVITNNQTGPDCEGTANLTVNQSAPAPVCTISANPNPCTIPAGSTVCSSAISWNTNTNVDVKLSTGELFAQSGSGSSSQPANGITQNGHTFNCIDRSSGAILGHVRVSGVPTSVCTPNPSSCSAPTPSCGQTTTGVDNCRNACSITGSACQPQGGQSQSQSQTQTQTVNITNPAPVIQTFGNVGVGTSGQVLGVKELPKTGLPALIWSALALIPTGFGMRKFRSLKKVLADNPNFIWEDRQFKS